MENSTTTNIVNNNVNSLSWIIAGSVIALLAIATASGYLLLRKLGYFPPTHNMTVEEYEKRKADERKKRGIDVAVNIGDDNDATQYRDFTPEELEFLENAQRKLDEHSKIQEEIDNDIKELKDSNAEQENELNNINKRLDVLEKQYAIIDIVGTVGVRIAQECLRTVDQGIEEMHIAGAALDASCAKTDELEKRKREVIEPLHDVIVHGKSVPNGIVYDNKGKENSNQL